MKAPPRSLRHNREPAQETFWGDYAGYFQDPDGDLREVVWDPKWEVE